MDASEAPAPRKKLYIETVGCQMNVLDSELVVARLREDGYELTDRIFEADTVLFNTCSVRQLPEDKVYSALGRIKYLKQTKPDAQIGVLGCMAQKDQAEILKRAPHVDVVIGPGQIARVADLLKQAREERAPQVAVSLARNAGSRLTVVDSFESYDPLREPSMRPSPFQAYVRVMMGCDKFCTFCIVPSVRGPEQSRPPESILAECKMLAGQGVREITFIGQTVNSYKYRSGDGRITRLSDLLVAAHEIDGVDRLKFVTNYPNDMTDDLLQAVRDLPKLSRYLHVPVQSGCDEVLRRMKRNYSVALYDDMMARIRETIPGNSVSSDFIVGFCGETEESFEKSLRLLERSRFKNSFIFKYSTRPGTKADSLYPDDIPDEVKKRRNNDLLAVQTVIAQELNRAFIGQEVEVLVEGPSERAVRGLPERGPVPQLVGRTQCDRIAVFPGPERLIGQLVKVRVVDATQVTLFAEPVTVEGVVGTKESRGRAFPTLPIINV